MYPQHPGDNLGLVLKWSSYYGYKYYCNIHKKGYKNSTGDAKTIWFTLNIVFSSSRVGIWRVACLHGIRNSLRSWLSQCSPGYFPLLIWWSEKGLLYKCRTYSGCQDFKLYSFYYSLHFRCWYLEVLDGRKQDGSRTPIPFQSFWSINDGVKMVSSVWNRGMVHPQCGFMNIFVGLEIWLNHSMTHFSPFTQLTN